MREPLQAWFNANQPADDLLWKDGLAEQVMFVRDRVAPLVGWGLSWEVRREGVAFVISTHRSKSVRLPVYELARPDGALRLILRNNFYDWKLSVISEVPLDCDFEHLFVTSKAEDRCNYLSGVYFEGFPGDLIFGHYDDSDRRRFSASIGGNHALWAAAFLVCRAAARALGWKEGA